MQPAALGVRFLLELLGLVALGVGGYHAADSGVARWLLALGIPSFAAAIWGVFRIPDDPKPAPVAVPGPVRLLIEACFFGGATVALVATGHQALAAAFGGAVLVDYVLLPARARRLARWR
ncbi:MAG: YrdB family protein [Dehalococcoidia bacterium]|nr:YrdB family protein [Dehalococcoidia bacterium]